MKLSARGLAILLALLSLTIWAGACGKHVEIDTAQLGTQLNARANSALNTPVVEKSLDGLFAAVSADAQVAKAGAALMSALGDDPRVQPAFGKILDSLGSQPVMQQMVKKLMLDHPGATPEQIGALVEKRVSAVIDGPAYDRAFNKAFDRFMKRPEINSVLNTFAEKAVRNPEAEQLIASTLANGAVEKKWRDRLVSLNGGSVPDRQHATDLLTENMLSVDRISKWYAKLYGLPTMKRETAAGVARLLEAAPFRRLTADLVVALVGDATFQKRAVDGMVTLLGDAPSDEALEKAIGRLLDVPVFSTALATWMKGLMADHELATIGDGMLKAIVAAPEIRAVFGELVDVGS